MYLLSLIIASHIKKFPSSYRVVAVSVVAENFFCPQLRKKNCSELWEYIKMCCALLYVLRLTNSLLLYNTTLAGIRVLLHTCNNNITYRKKSSLCIFLCPLYNGAHIQRKIFSLSLSFYLKLFSSLAIRSWRQSRKKINNYNCDFLCLLFV